MKKTTCTFDGWVVIQRPSQHYDGHIEPVSLPCHIFIWAGLDRLAVDQYLSTFFRQEQTA